MTRGSVSRNYSSFNPVVLEKEKRLKKASIIVSILKKEIKRGNNQIKVLDVGCSSGVITNELAKNFGSVLGIDIDHFAIRQANNQFKRKNLKFEEKDATETGYKNNSFDLIVANQIYYCFRKPEEFFNEMHRILKPRGLIYLGARNKYTLWDAQYHLPLLAFMPKALAGVFVRTFGRSEKFDVQYRDYWQLKKLTNKFSIKTYSPKIVQSYHKALKFIPDVVFKILEPSYPNFIWILRKKEAF